jgi:hypothetical protein
VRELRRVVDTLVERRDAPSHDALPRAASSPPPPSLQPSTHLPPPHSSGRQPSRASVDSTSHSNGLNLLHLEAPITAVHAMTPGISGSPDTRESASPSTVTTNPSVRSTTETSGYLSRKNGDLVSQGLLPESRARQLFHLYKSHFPRFRLASTGRSVSLIPSSSQLHDERQWLYASI